MPVAPADGKADNKEGVWLLAHEAALSAPRKRIAAGSDVEAINAWLAEYRGSPQTWRTYRKEAERLLLWLQSQGLGLRELRRDHLAHFDTFLADPRPKDQWIGPLRPRDHPGWRPFRQPLSASSRRQSLVILQGLCSWLVEAGWIDHNPFRLMRDKRRRLNNRQTSIERYLERPLWEWLWQWLERPPAGEASRREWMLWQRRRLIFAFAYLLAPRISEMATARMSDFTHREGYWWWQVVGKGGKWARVPVPPDMLELLGEWRTMLGSSAQPQPEDDSPVLRSLNGQRGLSDNQLYRLIKATFMTAAQALEAQAGEGTQHMANVLRRASPHWLRHTAITHQAQNGVELRYLAKTARHARLDTTARYLHAEAEEWQRQLSGHGVGRRDRE